MLSALFQDKGANGRISFSFEPEKIRRNIEAYILNPDRALTSPQPPRAEQEEIRSENGKKESKQLQQQEVPIVGSEDDRKVADILLQDIFQNLWNHIKF